MKMWSTTMKNKKVTLMNKIRHIERASCDHTSTVWQISGKSSDVPCKPHPQFHRHAMATPVNARSARPASSPHHSYFLGLEVCFLSSAWRKRIKKTKTNLLAGKLGVRKRTSSQIEKLKLGKRTTNGSQKLKVSFFGSAERGSTRQVLAPLL